MIQTEEITKVIESKRAKIFANIPDAERFFKVTLLSEKKNHLMGIYPSDGKTVYNAVCISRKLQEYDLPALTLGHILNWLSAAYAVIEQDDEKITIEL